MTEQPADLKPFLAKAATGTELTRQEARDAFDILMSGAATASQIGGLLMAMRVRGETVDEITGAVASLRARMTPVAVPAELAGQAIDIVGTGGDASGTYNISTTTALVVAGAGVPVAKHGNRALSSKSGAGDVLAALGVDLDIGPDRIAACIAEAGIGFMFAPNHHPAMRHVGPSRVELGTRTIFNLLGPLSNPAGVTRYMLGVFDRAWVEPIARVLANLGAEAAWVVHGAFGEAGGLDEISTTGPTHVAALEQGAVRTFDLTPGDFGLNIARPDDLKGGTGEDNAAALRAVLDGQAGPYRAYRDCVLANAAAALIVAGRAPDIAGGMRMAAEAMESGAAARALATLVAVSNRAVDQS